MLSKCTEHAKNSDMRYQLCAIVAKGNRILSIGWNHWNHPNVSTHAEVHALTRAVKTVGADLYIARIKSKGVGLAMPCTSCLKKIKKAGIKNIFFTLDGENIPFVKINTNDISFDSEKIDHNKNSYLCNLYYDNSQSN